MEIVAGTNPFNLFQSWFEEAVAAEINDPDAIALASVNAAGMPCNTSETCCQSQA